MNNIGDILKRLREENSLTGKEAVEKLKELGIDISAKTLYGYESGRNSTNADMFLALCKIYKCQNIMSIFGDSADEVLFTNKEWEIIEKYRLLDPHGKKMVDFTLNEEWERSTADAKAAEKVVPMTVHEDTTYVNAAHDDENSTPEERQAGDDIMMDDSEWE